MDTRDTWTQTRVELLLQVLSGFGMSLSPPAAIELITDRVRSVADQMGISPTAARTYLTDAAVAGLARQIAVSFAEEAPGANLLDAPRTTAVPLPVLGRTIAGLSEATKIRLNETDNLDHIRVSVAHLAEACSTIGLILAEEPGTGSPALVMTPPALLKRAARYLIAAADLVTAGTTPRNVEPAALAALPDTLIRDAETLRALASGD